MSVLWAAKGCGRGSGVKSIGRDRDYEMVMRALRCLFHLVLHHGNFRCLSQPATVTWARAGRPSQRRMTVCHVKERPSRCE